MKIESEKKNPFDPPRSKTELTKINPDGILFLLISQSVLNGLLCLASPAMLLAALRLVAAIKDSPRKMIVLEAIAVLLLPGICIAAFLTSMVLIGNGNLKGALRLGWLPWLWIIVLFLLSIFTEA